MIKISEIKNIFVAVDNGKIVDKRYRRKGVGKKLFAEIVKVAKTKKANIMTETPILNKKTIGIYKKLKFKPVEFVFLYKTTRRC